MGKNKYKGVTPVMPGPVSRDYTEPKKPVVPEAPLKKYRYYCEACSHTTEITEGKYLPIIKCSNCGKDNQFDPKNLLPL